MACLRPACRSGLILMIGSFLLAGCGGGSGGAGNSNASNVTPVNVSSTTYDTAGYPFQALPLASGDVLVSVSANGNTGSTTGIETFTPGVSGLTASCVNALPAALLGPKTGAFNLSLFPEATAVALGTGYPGALFYHLADLLAAGCTASGFQVGQGSAMSNNVITNDAGTLSVAVTPDGRYAFVDNEYGIAPGSILNGNIGVIAIQRDASGNFITGTTLIGQIPTGGVAIAGMLLSPDGNRLYVTSELTAAGTIPAGTGNPVLFHGNCTQTNSSSPTATGILSVINVAAAEATPDSTAIMSTVAAGCSPTRMVETADDKTLWLSARGDNRVLAFDTALLESNPDVSLVGDADSGGIAPVGLGLFDKDHYLAVANSDRFSTPLVDGNVAILDVSVPARVSVVETTPAGLFPREIDVGPDDSTLYLTNYISGTLQVISTSITP